MDALARIGSTLVDFIYAGLRLSAANLPAGFLVLIFAALMIVALPEGARRRVRLACMAAFGLIVSLSLAGPLNWAAIIR